MDDVFGLINNSLNNHQAHREVIEDICDCHMEYCLLKEVLLHAGIDDKILEYMKCIERFKYEESSRIGYDLGDGAFKLWVKRGYAQKFNAVYREGMMHQDIWGKIFPEQKEERYFFEGYMHG